MTKLKTSDFFYDLPKELIAAYPLPERSASRLMLIDPNTQEISHHIFNQLDNFLRPTDLLIFNNTKVMPARLYGQKTTGGKIECLVEKILDQKHALAHVRANKKLKLGTCFRIADTIEMQILAKRENLFEVELLGELSVLEVLHRYGHVPLPLYINRHDEDLDQDRYQTVYAAQNGAVAAPTAGLHFDTPLLQNLQNKGIQFAYVTLHIGAGTFQPVKTESLLDHQMHSEYMCLEQTTCDLINHTRQNGGRIIAVGTTVVRCLETAARDGKLRPYTGETNIFIYPGFQFRCTDALITNFHLPQSTLLMLVSAFAGREFILQAYETAIQKCYRFYSYGDAMLVLKKTSHDPHENCWFLK